MNPARSFLLAWRLLADRPGRFALSTLGIAFAVVVMFAELGFRNGIADSSALLPPLLDCDLVVSHVSKEHLRIGSVFPLQQVHSLRSVPGVAAAVPLYTAGCTWAHPENGYLHNVLLLGVDLDRPLLRLPAIAAHRSLLRQPDTILFDRAARPELGRVVPGTPSALGGHAVRVVGLVTVGANFTYDAHLVAGAGSFRTLTGQPAEHVDLGLVTVTPGESVAAVRARLLAHLGPSVVVLTPAELAARETHAMSAGTPVGIVFNLGLLVGCAIGAVVCYQILFNEVTDLLPQFAMLKVIGRTPRFLAAVVLHQALILSLTGFVAGLLGGLGVYAVLVRLTGLPMWLDFSRAGLILGCSCGMCLAAGLLAIARTRSADPADLF